MREHRHLNCRLRHTLLPWRSLTRLCALPPLAGILLLTVCAHSAMATSNIALCEPEPAAQAAANATQLNAVLPQELEKLSQCQNDSAWLAWVGWALNQLKRYSEAIDYLERSLMLDPDPPRTQLDYAIALAGSGDGLASLQLMQALFSHPQLPPPLRIALQREIARWGPLAQPTGWRQHRYLVVRLGHDNNLLGSPDLSSLTLTTPGQTVQLPLDASYARQPGNYLRTDVYWNASKGPWQLAASLGGRASSRQGAGLGQAQITAEYQASAWYLGASLAALNASVGTRYRATGLSGGLQWRSDHCASRLGLEWQRRNLSSSPILSSDYSGGLLQLSCEPSVPRAWPLGLQLWHASLRWGQDQPQNTQRAGGHQQQSQLRLVALGQGWGAQHQWQLDGEAYMQADAVGYSPLLQNNAVRRMRRLVLRAEYSWPLAPSSTGFWQLALGLEWQRQRANLALFQQRSQGAYLALRSQW